MRPHQIQAATLHFLRQIPAAFPKVISFLDKLVEPSGKLHQRQILCSRSSHFQGFRTSTGVSPQHRTVSSSLTVSATDIKLTVSYKFHSSLVCVVSYVRNQSVSASINILLAKTQDSTRVNQSTPEECE